MRKILSFPITIIHFITTFIILCVFHVLQALAHNLFGYAAHRRMVDGLNFFFAYNLFTLLNRPVFKGFDNVPKNKPLIIVSNHQSLYDISPIGWGFRKYQPKFISKKELGKNIPSISYNLRNGGSVLIDRNSGSQAIKEIIKLGRNMEQKNWSVCIFPEGSRSTTGELRKFQPAGFKTLLKASPNALVVPFAINGNYKLHKWGKFPLNIGLKLTYTAMAPIPRENKTDEEILELARIAIKDCLGN